MEGQAEMLGGGHTDGLDSSRRCELAASAVCRNHETIASCPVLGGCLSRSVMVFLSVDILRVEIDVDAEVRVINDIHESR